MPQRHSPCDVCTAILDFALFHRELIKYRRLVFIPDFLKGCGDLSRSRRRWFGAALLRKEWGGEKGRGWDGGGEVGVGVEEEKRGGYMTWDGMGEDDMRGIRKTHCIALS